MTKKVNVIYSSDQHLGHNPHITLGGIVLQHSDELDRLKYELCRCLQEIKDSIRPLLTNVELLIDELKPGPVRFRRERLEEVLLLSRDYQKIKLKKK